MKMPLLYNPSRLSKEDFLCGFVGREAELALLMQALRDAPASSAPQHILLVGERGMGKTSLLWRLGYAVEDDPALSQTWLPVRFDEEQYNVGELADFWLNTLHALLHDHGDPELQATVDRLEQGPLRDGELEAETYDALVAWATAKSRRLLLLVDNFPMILRRLRGDHEVHRLRYVLQHEPRLMLVGGAPELPSELVEYSHPFYELLRTVQLQALDDERMRRFLEELSKRFEAPQVAQRLKEHPGELSAMRHLIGGNPRTAAVLFGVLGRAGDQKDFLAQFEAVLDQHTSTYKERIESLSPQMQQVFDALAMAWHPAQAKDLAKTLRMDEAVVSTQLSRLIDKSLVRRVETDQRGSSYLVRERLFNLWLLMRGGRRGRDRFRWFVQLVEMFYTRAEAHLAYQNILNHLPSVDRGAETVRSLLTMAGVLAEHATHRETAKVLFESAERPDLGSVLQHLGPILAQIQARHDARQLARLGLILEALVDGQDKGIPLWELEQIRVQAEVRCVELRGTEDPSVEAIAFALLAGIDRLQGRYIEAEQHIREALRLEVKDYLRAQWRSSLGEILRLQERLSEAEEEYRVALEWVQQVRGSVGGASAFEWQGMELSLHWFLARVLAAQLRWSLAEEHSRVVVDLCTKRQSQEGQAQGLLELGHVIENQRRWSEAEGYYRQAIELWRILKNTEAEAATAADLGDVTRHQSQFDQAEGYYLRALDLSAHLENQEVKTQALIGLAQVAVYQERWESARSCAAAALDLCRQQRNVHQESLAIAILYATACQLGQASEEDAYARSLAQITAQNADDQDVQGLSNAVHEVAVATSLVKGHLEDAGRHLQRWVENRRSIPNSPQGSLVPLLLRYTRASGIQATLTLLRNTQTEEQFKSLTLALEVVVQNKPSLLNNFAPEVAELSRGFLKELGYKVSEVPTSAKPRRRTGIRRKKAG